MYTHFLCVNAWESVLFRTVSDFLRMTDMQLTHRFWLGKVHNLKSIFTKNAKGHYILPDLHLDSTPINDPTLSLQTNLTVVKINVSSWKSNIIE